MYTFKYFIGCVKVEHVKKLFRELAMRWHPDRGGDLRTMQEINAEYLIALKTLHKSTSMGSDKKEHTYYYNEETESSLMNKIYELLGLKLPNVEIALIGTWIWITGDTRPVKDRLKACGLRWHSKREAWYYQNDGYHHRYNPNASLASLGAAYGYKQFKGSEQLN